MGTPSKPPADFDVEALKKEILESIKAVATAEADKIIADAKAKAQEIMASGVQANVPAQKKMTAKQAAQNAAERMNELVEVKLIWDGDKYKDDVFVSVNDKTYLIKRGVFVKVPRCVALQIEENRRQELIAIRLADDLAQEYKETEAKYFVR